MKLRCPQCGWETDDLLSKCPNDSTPLERNHGGAFVPRQAATGSVAAPDEPKGYAHLLKYWPALLIVIYVGFKAAKIYYRINSDSQEEAPVTPPETPVKGNNRVIPDIPPQDRPEPAPNPAPGSSTSATRARTTADEPLVVRYGDGFRLSVPESWTESRTESADATTYEYVAASGARAYVEVFASAIENPEGGALEREAILTGDATLAYERLSLRPTTVSGVAASQWDFVTQRQKAADVPGPAPVPLRKRAVFVASPRGIVLSLQAFTAEWDGARGAYERIASSLSLDANAAPPNAGSATNSGVDSASGGQ